MKHLSLPPKIKIGKNTFKEIAKACPHIQSLDLGFHDFSGAKAKDSDLIEIVERFPNLTSISTNMWSHSSRGVSSMAKALGGQLIELKISGLSMTCGYLTDSTMIVIAEYCKNLKSFTYKFDSFREDEWYESLNYDFLTNRGVVALVKGCPRLEYFSLSNVKKVTEEAFTAILEMLEQANAASAHNTGRQGGYALQKIDLKGYPFEVTGNPLRLISIDRTV